MKINSLCLLITALIVMMPVGYSLGDTVGPAALTATAVSNADGTVSISWNRCNDGDFKEYHVVVVLQVIF